MEKNRIRYSTGQLILFQDPTRGFGEFPCTQQYLAEFSNLLTRLQPAPLTHFCRTGGFVSDSVVDPVCLSWILIFIRPGSQIPDPTRATKGGSNKICCLTFSVATNFTKLKIIIFEQLTTLYRTGGAVCKGATPLVEQPGGRGLKPRLRSLLD
jgi:hypothetical protein